jgi:hypothetical protein
MKNNTSSTITNLASFAKMERFLTARRDSSTAESEMSFEEFEVSLSQIAHEVENEIKADELSRYDVSVPEIHVEGNLFRKSLENEKKRYMTASGPIVVERNLYRPQGGGKCICPLELRAGIVGGIYTPVMARQVTYMMGNMTSVETSKLFEELNIEGPSSSSCDRLPKLISEKWEKNRADWENALREQETVPAEAALLAVSLDGVMVPDKDGQREAKKKREEAAKKNLAKQYSGPAGYKEVGCGTVTLYAEQQKEDKAPPRLETVRYGRAPEYKKQTLTEQLDAEVESILSVRPDLILVAIADGAEENWRYFDKTVYTDAVKIVDFGHACEHLREAMVAYKGKRSTVGRAEYEKLKVILRDQDDGVETVIAQLTSIERKLKGKKNKKQRELFHAELKYFKNQKARMRYADYQKRGLPIGSGVIEATCKTLATQRLKRSGMSWRDGKQAILTLRSLQQSNRWQRAWTLLSESYRGEVMCIRNHGHLQELYPVGLAS